MKRTLMFKNQELLDFEVDAATRECRILDAPGPEDALLASLGFGGPDRETMLRLIIGKRCISANRGDIRQILAAFDARFPQELALKGQGLSLMDQLWYRAPGSTARWEDINFFDNDWDDSFRTSTLTRDYKSLASCSLDVPDITTGGHLIKAWERCGDTIQLLKEPLFEHEGDFEGALLASELCRRLFGQNAYQPLSLVERFGRRFSASPLMIGRDEELIQGPRLYAIGGYDSSEAKKLAGPTTPEAYIDVISRAGVADAHTHVAKIFAFKALAILGDMHDGNLGIIRNGKTETSRGAPPFDYDRSFGFPSDGFPIERLCNNPSVAVMLCARAFSDLEESWDWSWYDPHALEGFEDLIVKTYAPLRDMPSNFGELTAKLFVMQRNYVNETAGAR